MGYAEISPAAGETGPSVFSGDYRLNFVGRTVRQLTQYAPALGVEALPVII
jgi:hypothetical protein